MFNKKPGGFQRPTKIRKNRSVPKNQPDASATRLKQVRTSFGFDFLRRLQPKTS